MIDIRATSLADKYIDKDGKPKLKVVAAEVPLDQVEAFLRRFVVYPNEHAIVAHALWIAHAHLMEIWNSTPRLIFASNAPASGKTRALEVTELLVPSPELSANMSAAAMVRVIAKAREEDRFVTVLFDELDRTMAKSEEGTADLLSALNAGYRRNGKFKRCINSGASVADFPCYAAVALAALRLDRLPEALVSRSAIINMKPRANDEPKEDFELDETPEQAVPVYDALAEWVEQKKVAISNHRRPDRPAEVRDRAADIWKPLFIIADIAGGDWPLRARKAAVFLLESGKDVTAKSGSDTELLIHIREAFLLAGKIHTDELIRRLINREDSPWADVGKGRPLTGRALADRLRPYGIHSAQEKISGLNRNGYLRANFEDAWKHYVDASADPSSTNSTNSTKLSNKDKKVELVDPVDLCEPDEVEP